MRWITVLVVCSIFVFIMNPIERAVKRKFQNKVAAYLITFAIGLAILLTLYTIAHLLSFPIFR